MRYIVCLLFIFSSAFQWAHSQVQAPPLIQWQKSLGGSQDDMARDIAKAIDGGFIIVGSSRSNNGDVTGHHGSTDSTDGWVVKLSPDGDIEWQKSFGGTRSDVFTSVIATQDGNFICFGNTRSNDGDVSGNHSGADDLWVVKIDRFGTILWQKCLGGTSTEIPGNIRENKDRSLFVIGTTQSNNGDVSGNFTPTKEIWVLKLESSGAMRWQKCFGGSDDDEGLDIVDLNNGYYLINAIINSDYNNLGNDFGFRPRGYTVKIDSLTHTMFWKLKREGTRPLQLLHQLPMIVSVNYAMTGCPARPNAATEQSVFVDQYNPNYPPNYQVLYKDDYCPPAPATTIGYKMSGPSGIAELPLDDGIVQITQVLAGASDDTIKTSGFNGGVSDGYVCRYNVQPGTLWRKFVGGSGLDELVSVEVMNEREFLVAGFSNSNDGDVSGNHGGYDFWVVKFGKANAIKGSVFIDHNSNGSKETDEPYLRKSIMVESSKGAISIMSNTFNGQFKNIIGDTGTYRTEIASTIPYYVSVPAFHSNTFTSYYNTDSISFALQPIPGKRDYRVDLFAVGPARPGFEMVYLLQCINVGTDTLINRQIKLVKDKRLWFLSATPAQVSIQVDTIVWNISNLFPGDTLNIVVNLRAFNSPPLFFGMVVVSLAKIDPSGDVDEFNNYSQLVQNVVGSYDPNDKQENQGGILYKEDYETGQALNYTIRFQNTGNDTAFNVVVCDTLDTKLDLSTIEMVNASHPYVLTIKNGRYLVWTFNNILLVDSFANEPLSHGYISYRIKPVSNLKISDIIKNSASIYFDFNQPVQTNITRTTLLARDSIFVCAGQTVVFYAKAEGLGYQWQVNTGNGFSNISDNSYYKDANAPNLQINPTADFYNYMYRCVVTSNEDIVYSPVYTLKIGTAWVGKNSSDWNDPANWSCNTVPDQNTDVFIPPNVYYPPSLTYNTTVRSLTIQQGAYITISTGFSITIKK